MNIYVGNLAGSVSEKQLKDLFEQHGKVASVKIITDKFTGNSRGFGFVEMPSADEAQQAIDACNGYEFDGKSIKVNESKPRPEGYRPRTGGGNRFGGNSGGSDFGGGFGGGRGGNSRGPRNRY